MAMNAWVTCLGSFDASTGLSTVAPRRAIGVPSAASRVTDGGVGGCSDLESGAVIASQPTRITNRTMNAAIVRTRIRPQRRFLRTTGRLVV